MHLDENIKSMYGESVHNEWKRRTLHWNQNYCIWMQQDNFTISLRKSYLTKEKNSVLHVKDYIPIHVRYFKCIGMFSKISGYWNWRVWLKKTKKTLLVISQHIIDHGNALLYCLLLIQQLKEEITSKSVNVGNQETYSI